MDNSYQSSPGSWHNVTFAHEPGPDTSWDSGGGCYPTFGLVSNEENLYQQQWRYTSDQDSPVSSHSSHSLRSSHEDGNINCATPYTHQQTYIFDASTAMSIQSLPFASFHLDEPFCSQNNVMPMTLSFSPMTSSPFHLMCPASNPKRLCSCTNLTHEALLELPHKQHLGSKPLRAAPDPCRKALVELFPFECRNIVIEILSDPLSRIPLLMHLVVRYDKDTQGNRFGCICCPNARFQAAAKAERHLRGLFDIRTVPCRYCAKLSIHRDDNKDHEKICSRKNKRTPYLIPN